MIKIKQLLVILLGINALAVHSQHTDMINSNRPGLSQSAFSVGKNVFQLESGVYGITQEHDISKYEIDGMGLDLTLRYGFFLEQLELMMDTQFQMDKYSSPGFEENRSGIKNLVVGAKYLIYDPWKNYEEKPNLYSWKANHRFKWRQLIPAVSVFAGANFSIGDTYFAPDEPSFSPKAMVIAQNHLGTSWVLVTNIYLNKISTDYQTLGYVVTLTKGFNYQWSGFIENQGFKSDYYSDGIFRIGAAYLIQNNWQVDASIGASYKDTPSLLYGGIGTSWRFDKNYKPVKIESGKEDGKSKQQKKKDKKKEKERKRLDEVTE